jgi:hypothetical protein
MNVPTSPHDLIFSLLIDWLRFVPLSVSLVLLLTSTNDGDFLFIDDDDDDKSTSPLAMAENDLDFLRDIPPEIEERRWSFPAITRLWGCGDGEAVFCAVPRTLLLLEDLRVP